MLDYRVRLLAVRRVQAETTHLQCHAILLHFLKTTKSMLETLCRILEKQRGEGGGTDRNIILLVTARTVLKVHTGCMKLFQTGLSQDKFISSVLFI